jgi:hypothetical protein
LYLLPNGKINSAAFKHNDFLSGTKNRISHVSGLYRAARWEGKLSGSEAPLGIISAAIRANPALGSAIGEFIHINESFDKSDKNDYPSVFLEQLLAYVAEKGE